MPRPFHRPVHRPSDVIDTLFGGGDPAARSNLAHDSAAALLHRVRGADDDEIIERLVTYTDKHGVDDIAELWSSADSASLPGALWRLYLIRLGVTGNPDAASYRFRRGLALDSGVNHAVSGAPDAPEPAQMVSLCDQILRGAFTGDFADALDRAAAFCHVMAQGSADLLDGELDEARADREAERGVQYQSMADELTRCAQQWRQGKLS